MATAPVTGTLADFGRGNLASRMPVIYFIPSGPTVTLDGFTLSPVPIEATLDLGTGLWTAWLEPVENMVDPQYYNLRIKLLNPASLPSSADFPPPFMDFPWQLYVPTGGGALTQIVKIPLGAGLIWTIPGGAIPPEAKRGDIILDTTTSDYFRIG